MMSNFISHAERMSMGKIHYPKNLSAPYQIVTAEDAVENDRIVKKAAVGTFDPTTHYDGVKVSDFYLENIIAVGALESLREGNVGTSRLDAADNASVQIDNIDNYIVDNMDVKPNNTNE